MAPSAGSGAYDRLMVIDDVNWVSRFLVTYCGPGRHEFTVGSPDMRWCLRCYKEEAIHRTCLICDSRADAVFSFPENKLTDPFEGELCSHCNLGLARLLVE